MYVMERLIDLAAGKTGIDRVELRRRNLIPPDAMPYRNANGLTYDCGAFEAVMENLLQRRPKIVQIFVQRGPRTHFIFIEPVWSEIDQSPE